MRWRRLAPTVLLALTLLAGSAAAADGAAPEGGGFVRATLRTVGIAALTLFMPLTALSFYRFRLPRKKDEYERMVTSLHGADDLSSTLVPTIRSEYSAGDYLLPVFFASVVTLLGTMTLILGEDIRVTETPTLLFSGLPCANDDFQLCHTRHLLVLSMAFIGAYVWSIQSIFRRLVTIDLPPGAYYGVGIRIIFAGFLALLLEYGEYMWEPFGRGVPVLAFLTGIFPEQMLKYLKGKTRIFATTAGTSADELPLDMIEGVNLFHRVRLSEVGIDNAQNLAEASLVELLVRTPFRPRLLIDWIAQARLYVLFKDDVIKLRQVGVRTVLDFKVLAGIDGYVQEIAKSTGIAEIRLTSAQQLVATDPSVQRLAKAAASFGVI